MIPMIITGSVMIAVTSWILMAMMDGRRKREYIEPLRTKRGQNTVKDRSWRDL